MSDATAAVTSTDEMISPYEMLHEYTMATSATIYQGSGVALDASGNAVHASNAGAVQTVGRASKTVSSAAAGQKIGIRQGIFRWTAGSNPPLAANKWQKCYWQDDQTVTLTPGTLMAGLVYDVDSQGVWVLTGLGFTDAESAPAAGKVYLTLPIADLVSADAKVYHIASPVAGIITSLRTSLQAHALAGGNATLTGKIGSTAITTGVVTMVQSGSAIGDSASAAPTAANVVAVGSDINFTVGGTQTDTAANATLVIEITTA